MVDWSEPVKGMRVGTEYWTDGYNTDSTAVNVWARVWIRIENTRYQDTQRCSVWGQWGNHEFDFPNSQGSVGTYEFAINTFGLSAGLSYNYPYTVGIGVAISQAYNGANPTVTNYYTVPARPSNVPTVPGFRLGPVTPNSAVLYVDPADGRGAGIDGYQVLVGWDGSSVSSIINSQVGNWGGGSGTATGLTRSTNYGAVARAHNGVGWSDWSGIIRFNTLPDVPSPPRNVRATSILATTATLEWDAPADNGGRAVTSYGVQLSTEPSFSGVGALPNGNLTGLAPGTRYYARVRAGNEVGASGWSATVSFTTLTGAFVKVSGEWRRAVVYLKVNGVWRAATAYKKVSGQWKS